MSHDDGESLAPGSGALTYAMLTAEARRQAALPRPKARGRREADVRRVPWWRVRTLRGSQGCPLWSRRDLCGSRPGDLRAGRDSSLARRPCSYSWSQSAWRSTGATAFAEVGVPRPPLARAACAPAPCPSGMPCCTTRPGAVPPCWCCSRQAGATTSGPRRYWSSGLCRCLSPGSRGTRASGRPARGARRQPRSPWPYGRGSDGRPVDRRARVLAEAFLRPRRPEAGGGQGPDGPAAGRRGDGESVES